MKILLFSRPVAESAVRGGGSVIWCQSFVRMLRARGHEVHIFTYGEKINILDCDEFLKDLSFVKYRSKWSWIDSILFGDVPLIFKATHEAVRIVKNKHIDVIVSLGIHETAGFFFYNPSVPVFATCHGIYPMEFKMWFTGKRGRLRLLVYWLLEQFSKSVCEGIIHPSDWLKAKLKKRLKRVNNYVIRNSLRKAPLVKNKYSRQTLVPSLKQNIPVIVSFNLLIAPYDIEEFGIYLETVKKIVSLKKDIQFVLFGVLDGKKEWVSNTTKDLPIHILGYVKNIFEILQLADIFLHVTFTDTFSYITLEAMSLGVPVVVTNEGALPELVENEKTGLLADLNPDALANAVIGLIDDKEKVERLGRAAKNYANSNYNEMEIGKEWEDLLLSKIN